MNKEYSITLICLIQIVSIYNALLLGWKVKKIGIKTYEFSKKMEDPLNFDFNNFINQVVSFNLKHYK